MVRIMTRVAVVPGQRQGSRNTSLRGHSGTLAQASALPLGRLSPGRVACHSWRMATSPSALPTSRGTWSSAKKPLAGALASAVVLCVCFALFALARDHGSGSADKVGASSRASFSTFAGYWWGHGRGLNIHRSGSGLESTRTYFNRPPYNATLRFDVISVSGSEATADARIRVTAVRNSHHTLSHVPIRIGESGTLRLRHGVITDSLTHITYCGPRVARCGA